MTSDRCPECGSALCLRVAARTPMSMWWLSAVFGIAASVCMAAWIVSGAVRSPTVLFEAPRLRALVSAGMASPSDLPRWSFILASSTLFAASLLLLARLITGRRSFDRLSTPARVLLGLSCLGAMPVLLLLVNLFVRIL